MNHPSRAFRVLSLLALVVSVGVTGLAMLDLRPVARAAAAAQPAQQAVQASGYVTLGLGTCFPDAILVDCDGNVVHQLKGPGGSGYFTPYLDQWVDLEGTELTCVVGDKYVAVTSIQASPPTCGTPATPTPPVPSATPAVPGATPTPPLPPGVTPTATAIVGGNLALGKAIYASSAPDPAHPAAGAVDGNDASTWLSIPDPQPVWNVRHVQWIYVDLGADYSVKDMRMLWVDGRHPRVYGVHVWRQSWNAWQWLARTDYGKPDDPVRFPSAVEGRYFMLWLEVPHIAGSAYELREWQIGGDVNTPVQSTNVAAGKASVAYSHEPGFEAAKATDADLASEWRSSTGLPQWLYVDLATTVVVDRAILRWSAGMHATSYTLYAWDGYRWWAVYSTTRGSGGDETVSFSPARTRYLLVHASAGPATNVGLRELEVYERRGSTGGGAPLSRPLAAGSSWAFGSETEAQSALGGDAGRAEALPPVRGLRLLDPDRVPDPTK